MTHESQRNHLKAVLNPLQQIENNISPGLSRVRIRNKMTEKEENGWQLRLNVEDRKVEVHTTYGYARVVDVPISTLIALQEAVNDTSEKPLTSLKLGVIINEYLVSLVSLPDELPEKSIPVAESQVLTCGRFADGLDIIYGAQVHVHNLFINRDLQKKEVLALCSDAIINKGLLEQKAQQVLQLLSPQNT